jgi:hypothetical protein
MGLLSGLAFAAFYRTLGVSLARVRAVGGMLSDRLASRRQDSRYYLWIPALSVAHYFIAARTLREEEVKA